MKTISLLPTSMAIKLSLLLLISFSLLLLLLPSHCQQEEESAEEKLFDCFTKCGRGPSNQHELTHCEQKCVQQYQERKRQEREEGGGRTQENHHHPEQQYKQCRSTCARQEQGEPRQLCEQRCQWKYDKQRREHGDVITNPARKQETTNPYFFGSDRFTSKYRSEEGHIKVLERFSKKSELLQGIDNYRLAVLEANPNTFLLPHHCDAEAIYVVVGGRGTISYVWRNQRQSYNLEQGDVMRVPAGSIVYLINRDDNERLYILKLLQPVNAPGRFKEYFGVGGENPESFYRSFSNEILEAAFNAPREKLERLFGQQRKGIIIRASKEQIRALSQDSETSSKGRRGEWWGPFNLKNERPLFSNQFGQYFEASPNDHKQLRDLDVSVGFMNIKKGAMTAPYYNSRATRLAFVVGGSGYFEMACPHTSTQSKHGSQGRKEIRTDVHYEKIRARLSVGDAFVVPAGHPIAIVASQDSDLQLASLGIKGSGSQKYFLAGQDNIWNEVESEAKELSFNVPAREVEEIFRSQNESYFLPGPGQREKEEREGHYVASVLDFVGF